MAARNVGERRMKITAVIRQRRPHPGCRHGWRKVRQPEAHARSGRRLAARHIRSTRFRQCASARRNLHGTVWTPKSRTLVKFWRPAGI